MSWRFLPIMLLFLVPVLASEGSIELYNTSYTTVNMTQVIPYLPLSGATDNDWSTYYGTDGGISPRFINYTYNYPEFLNLSSTINFTVVTRYDRDYTPDYIYLYIWNLTSSSFQLYHTSNPSNYVPTFQSETFSGNLTDLINGTTVRTKVMMTGTSPDLYGQLINTSYNFTLEWNQTPTDHTFFSFEDDPTYSLAAQAVGAITYSINTSLYFPIGSSNGTIWTNTTENRRENVRVIATAGGVSIYRDIVLTNVHTPFYNCSGENISIRFFARNETNTQINTTDIELTISVTSPTTTNFSIQVYDVQNLSICIYPNNLEYTTDLIVKYSNTGFSTRYHFYDSLALTNDTKTINLYMIPTADATKTTYTLNDNFGNSLTNHILQVWKYDVGENTYYLVAMGKTNVDGEAAIYLKQSEFYKYLIYSGAELVDTIDKQILESSTQTIIVRLESTDILDYQWRNNFEVDCSYSNTTTTIICTVEDNREITNGFWFRVFTKRNSTYSWAEACSQTSTENPKTFTCDIAGSINPTGSKVWYEINGLYGTNYYQIYQGSPDSKYFYQSQGYGATGIFAAVILTIAIALAGLWNPAVALAFTGFSMIFVYFLQLVNMPWEVLGGGIVAIAIAAYLMKT